MSSDELISREEVLAGLPAKRANTLLFLIESRTAHLVARSQVEFSLTGVAAHDRDLAFLEAFALGHQPPLRPTIQDLEHYAPQWQPLVPENSRLKAAVAHALGQKYPFTHPVVPRIRSALDFDQEAVRQAYSRLYGKPLETIFISRLALAEQLRWTAAAIAQRLESLPPFWIASLVTVALGLPQACLALPIAVAYVGPLATLIFVIMIGAVNTLTMACMAEAIGRSGDFRYGNAFIKQLAANYLGNAGSFILSLAVGIRVFLIALACYIGLSMTMANFTPIPAQVWAALLFCVGLYLLSRKSLNFTVTVMILMAAINVSLLLLLSLLAFPHVQPGNLLYVNVPFFNQPLEPQVLEQVFGVSLMLYFGHVYVGECAKLTLPRDPSAAALIWGSIAGTAFLTVLLCLWVLAVNGAIPPEVLASQSGTALSPLVEQLGPIAEVLGAVLVILLLGMAWIRSSSLLINLGREWFPTQPRSILVLPAKRGTLILRPHSNSSHAPRFGLTYLGLEASQPRFRLDIQTGDTLCHVEITVAESWQIQELHNQSPELRQFNIQMILEVQSANPDSVRLRVTSPMQLAYEGEWGAEVANPSLELESQMSQQNLPAIARPIWIAIRNHHRFFLSISPLVFVFLLSEWLFLAGTQSFTSILGFAGVLGNSLVGGIFPVLLLVSSRQKGELVPGVAFQLLNHPLLIAGLYSLFLATLCLHGLFLWKNPIAQTTALGLAILSLAATLAMWCGGAFARRTVVELQEDPLETGQTRLTITAGGQPRTTEVRLGYADADEQCYQAATVEIPSVSSLRYAIFQLPTSRPEELRVWAHRGKPNGDFQSLSAFLEVHRGDRTMQFDLKLFSGHILLPLVGNPCWLKITLPEPSLS